MTDKTSASETHHKYRNKLFFWKLFICFMFWWWCWKELSNTSIRNLPTEFIWIEIWWGWWLQHIIYIVFMISKPFSAFRCSQGHPGRDHSHQKRNVSLDGSGMFHKWTQTMPAKCPHIITVPPNPFSLACTIFLMYVTCTHVLLKQCDSSGHHFYPTSL